ncbi:hypothetical protein T492DRAFT_1002409 [Pavlovales sp. CCMP2436]|nr:hypothetical protein T492DRAFT_1002409 [Pavlovales sp. CCMP2436]
MSLPDVSEAILAPAVEQLLRTEDWDTVTVKLIMRKLEELLADGAELPAGWIQPHKKLVKQLVDSTMAAILAEQQAAVVEEPAAEEEEEEEAAAEEEEEADADEEPEPKKAPSRKRLVARKDDDDDGEEEEPAAAADAADEEADGADALNGEDDDARFVGRALYSRSGKIHFNGWTSKGVTYRLGMDVYLEPPDSDDTLPYVARLIDVYAYAFAEDEVYFNARWYYRDCDVKQYGLRDAARAATLHALDRELYMSLHEDENHADTVDLIAKTKLRSVVVQELERQPTIVALRVRTHDAKRQRGGLGETPGLNSGVQHFALGVVLEVRHCQPYKVGKKISTIALQLRTGQARKLVRLDALSNEQFTRKEYDDFQSVPVTSFAVRDKSEKLRALEQSNVSLFTEEEQRLMEEETVMIQERLEGERAVARQKDEEEERRAREREEVRDRQNQKKVEGGDQWWKVHAGTTDTVERERAKWAARLKRFEAIAASSAEEGERTNAARLAESARKKLSAL